MFPIGLHALDEKLAAIEVDSVNGSSREHAPLLRVRASPDHGFGARGYLIADTLRFANVGKWSHRTVGGHSHNLFFHDVDQDRAEAELLALRFLGQTNARLVEFDRIRFHFLVPPKYASTFFVERLDRCWILLLHIGY
jgi:hypothetical protein